MIASILLFWGIPAGAQAPEDITGDITKPVIHWLTVSPATADVTNGSATFTITMRVTDDWSGVNYVSVSYDGPNTGMGYGTNPVLVSGDTLDGTYQATATIPQYAPPGAWGLYIGASDRVGNGVGYEPHELKAKGWPWALHVTDANPDATKPVPTGLARSTETVDVRNGPAQITIDVTATDSQSGVQWVSISALGPKRTQGGSSPPQVTRISGDKHNGVWRGTFTIPEFAPQGEWTIQMHVTDFQMNSAYFEAPDLAARGLKATFNVLSHEDAEPPKLTEFSVNPIEVNVHDEDQVINVRARLTDNITGVQHFWDNMHLVQFSAEDPVTRQSGGTGYMAKTSGTALDGVYEATISVPKSSATGLRTLRGYVQDEVDNWAHLQDAELAAAGGVPAILVYNVPLPPIPLGADPLDEGAVVKWDPPTDERGAEVTSYVVEEQPQGIVRTVDGDARSAVVDGLVNDVQHTFTVKAVNKAGPSDPSAAMSAVPSEDAAGPGPGGPGGSGYWMAATDGAVYAFGDADWLGNASVSMFDGAVAVDIERGPGGDGYWVVDSHGRVTAKGNVLWRGNAWGMEPGETATSISGTSTGRGYIVFTSKGKAMSFGDAPFFDDMRGWALNAPVLDSVLTPSGKGYYMVAADGGVFAFGDAAFAGSMGGARLNAPVQSLVPDPDGFGYWLVASDGGIFAFHAPFYGSMGGAPLNRPVSGMVGSKTGGGYLMVAEDGGIFAFGDVPFHGSLGSHPPPYPITSVARY